MGDTRNCKLNGTHMERWFEMLRESSFKSIRVFVLRYICIGMANHGFSNKLSKIRWFPHIYNKTYITMLFHVISIDTRISHVSSAPTHLARLNPEAAWVPWNPRKSRFLPWRYPIGSMVLVYMRTKRGYIEDIDGIHVTIYSSTMDPWRYGVNEGVFVASSARKNDGTAIRKLRRGSRLHGVITCRTLWWPGKGHRPSYFVYLALEHWASLNPLANHHVPYIYIHVYTYLYTHRHTSGYQRETNTHT